MTTALRDHPAHAGARNGGVPARRAVARWAWRLFRREWRQQLLVLALIVVAVAATVIGAAVATNNPPPANTGFGTAQDRATFGMPDPNLAGQIAALRHRFGRVEVIENQLVTVPGSIDTYDLRAQSPDGPFSQPMVSLVSGHFPTGPGQVALTGELASEFNVRTGGIWRGGGRPRLVTGIVQNPQSLLDSFALVVPGQVTRPDQVIALFDAPGVPTAHIGRNVATPGQVTSRRVVFDAEMITTAAVTLGMLLIALLAVGGFTVLAQRRLRSLGMLASMGATSTLQAMTARTRGIAASLGSHSILTLSTASATLYHAEAGRNWSGPVYVATPQLLHAFGISPAQINPDADILTMRPGLASTTRMQLLYGPSGLGPPPGNGTTSFPCPAGSCLANPVIQQISGLPSGTSAPNTVITEHAIHQFHLKPVITGWLIQAPNPPSAAQINNARLSASAANLEIETKSSVPSSAEVINWATVFGILLALGVLAMSVGLIRSETARDLSTLTAAGATSSARRTIAASTAAALGLLGALLGTVGGYVAAFAFFRNNSLDGLSSLSSIPVQNLLILIVGMPLFAAAAAWVLAGHEPAAISHQPIE